MKIDGILRCGKRIGYVVSTINKRKYIGTTLFVEKLTVRISVGDWSTFKKMKVYETKLSRVNLGSTISMLVRRYRHSTK